MQPGGASTPAIRLIETQFLNHYIKTGLSFAARLAVSETASDGKRATPSGGVDDDKVAKLRDVISASNSSDQSPTPKEVC